MYWAAGAESNNDLTGTLKTSALELAAGKLDAAGFISTMKKSQHGNKSLCDISNKNAYYNYGGGAVMASPP